MLRTSSSGIILSYVNSIVLNFILTAVMDEKLSLYICYCSDFFLLQCYITDHLIILSIGYLGMEWWKVPMHKAEL